MGALPPGAEGTRQTMAAMARLTKEAARTVEIWTLARQIVARVPDKNKSTSSYVAEVGAIQQWVRANIRYTRDVAGVETLARPIDTLAIRQGDCDDQSMLVAALLLSIGHPCRFVAVGRTLDSLQHVFTDTRVGDKWMAVETTENWQLGQRPDSRQYPATMVHNL